MAGIRTFNLQTLSIHKVQTSNLETQVLIIASSKGKPAFLIKLFFFFLNQEGITSFKTTSLTSYSTLRQQATLFSLLRTLAAPVPPCVPSLITLESHGFASLSCHQRHPAKGLDSRELKK